MIEWRDFGAAIALVFVIEGLLPLLSPRRFRETMLAAVQLEDRVLRALGLTSMVIGAVVLYFVRA